MAEKHVRFADLLTIHVNSRVQQQFLHVPLTTETLHRMQALIRSSIRDVFDKSRHKLSSEAIGWVANQYFKAARLNDAPVNDLVVINEYRLADMSFSDILLMRNLFDETTMSVELDAEYLRRTAS